MEYPKLANEKYQEIRNKLLTQNGLTNDSIKKYYTDTINFINKKLIGQSRIYDSDDYDTFIQKFISLCLEMYSYALQNNVKKIITPGASFDKFKFIVRDVLGDNSMEIINLPFSSGFDFVQTLDNFYKKNYKTILGENKNLTKKHNEYAGLYKENKSEANKIILEILKESNKDNKYELGKFLDIVLNNDYLDDKIKYLFEHTLKNNIEPIIQCTDRPDNNCQFGIIDFVVSGKGIYSFYILCLLYIKYTYPNDKTRMNNFIKNTHLIYYKSHNRDYDQYNEEFNFKIDKEYSAIEKGFPDAIKKLTGEKIKIKTKEFDYEVKYKGLMIDNYTSFDYQRCIPSYKYSDWNKIPNLEESKNCILEKIIFLDNIKKLSDSDYKNISNNKDKSVNNDNSYDSDNSYNNEYSYDSDSSTNENRFYDYEYEGPYNRDRFYNRDHSSNSESEYEYKYHKYKMKYLNLKELKGKGKKPFDLSVIIEKDNINNRKPVLKYTSVKYNIMTAKKNLSINYPNIQNFILNLIDSNYVSPIFTKENTKILFLNLNYNKNYIINEGMDGYKKIVNFKMEKFDLTKENQIGDDKYTGYTSNTIGNLLKNKGYDVLSYLYLSENFKNKISEEIINEISIQNEKNLNELNSSYKNLIIYSFGHCRVSQDDPTNKNYYSNEPKTPFISSDLGEEFSTEQISDILNRFDKPNNIYMIMYNCYAAHMFCPSLLNKMKNNIDILCSKEMVERVQNNEKYLTSAKNLLNNSILYSKSNDLFIGYD